MSGPTVRTDYVEALLFRRAGAVELLQLRRVEAPLSGTWQTVMGRIEEGETAIEAMWREVREETGLARSSGACLGAWSLDGAHPFYIARQNTIYLMPRFAVEVPPEWTPVLNEEHDDTRWVRADEADTHFMWPGQRAAIDELLGVLRPGSLSEPQLRLPI